MKNTQTNPSFDKIWKILERTARRQEENSQQIKELRISQKETDQQIQANGKYIRTLAEKTDQQIQANDKYIRTLAEKTDQQIQANDKHIRTLAEKTDQQIQANDKYIRTLAEKTDQQIQANDKYIRTLAEKTDQQIQANDKYIRTLAEKTDQQIQANRKYIRELAEKTDHQIAEDRKNLKKTRGFFENQWGELIESLVQGKLLQLLNEKKIDVAHLSQRVEAKYQTKAGNEKSKEFDLIAVNGTEVVAVEVKATLTPKNVDYFIESLKDFKNYFRDYKHKKIYGATAFLKSYGQAHIYSEKKGLFVIKATGDSASLINKKGFKPKVFA